MKKIMMKMVAVMCIMAAGMIVGGCVTDGGICPNCYAAPSK